MANNTIGASNDALKQVRKKMLEISRKLKENDCSNLKFLMIDIIGEAKLEKMSILDLLNALTKEYSITNLQILEDCFRTWLTDIGREDLIQSLFGSKVPKESADLKKKVTIEKTGTKLPLDLFEIIASQIAGDWKRLARRLGYDENVIDRYDLDYRKTYEKTYHIITDWSKENSQSVTWPLIKEKLEKIPRYDIIREIERKLPELSLDASTDDSASTTSHQPTTNGRTYDNQRVDFPPPTESPPIQQTNAPTESEQSGRYHAAQQESDSFESGVSLHHAIPGRGYTEGYERKPFSSDPKDKEKVSGRKETKINSGNTYNNSFNVTNGGNGSYAQSNYNNQGSVNNYYGN